MNLRIITAVFLMISLGTGSVHAGDLAVIVNRNNPITTISLKDLEKILFYEKTFWRDGSRIFLLVRESGSKEKNILMDKIYKITEAELKRLWLSKLFKGEIPSPPKITRSNNMMKRFVVRVPSAIGFIDSSSLDKTVKIIRVDGKLPGEKNYIFKTP